MESRYKDLNYALFKANIDRLEQIWNDSFEAGDEGPTARILILEHLSKLAKVHGLGEPKTFLELLNAFNKKTVLELLEKEEYDEVLKRIASSHEPTVYVLRWFKQRKPRIDQYFYGELLYNLLHQTKNIEFLTLFPQKYMDYSSCKILTIHAPDVILKMVHQSIFDEIYKHNDRELLKFIIALKDTQGIEPYTQVAKVKFEQDDFIAEGIQLFTEDNIDLFKQKLCEINTRFNRYQILAEITAKFTTNKYILDFLIEASEVAATNQKKYFLASVFHILIRKGSDREIENLLAYTIERDMNEVIRDDSFRTALNNDRWNIVSMFLPFVLDDLQNMHEDTIHFLLRSPNQNDVNTVVRALRSSKYHERIMEENV